ncbi:MAG: bifunctional precorrin-2 dehydrogenase/sirohydrochlorin ferrochelatase [Chloroflexi bacterium]|nr:MAG: bifunctional precorrin-2 dehydrogenase/sirohydrochlorin ferrochelatase [Chloroflexota bacterium]
MIYYPIFLDVQRKPVLLVGGGHVALEKIGKLIDHGADVTVVAPDLIGDVRAFIDAGRARWEQREFRDGETEGYFLVMVATDNGAVNRRVADEARARNILVNAADDADNCDFILPSLVRRGEIAIAASTGGTSPAMARWLRERLEEFMSDDVLSLASLLAEVRVAIRAGDSECASKCTIAETPPPLLCKQCPNRIPADRWQEAIDTELMTFINLGDMEAARMHLVDALGRSELQPSPTWREEVRP